MRKNRCLPDRFCASQLCINSVDRSSKLNPYFNVKKRSFRSNATCSIEIKDTDTGNILSMRFPPIDLAFNRAHYHRWKIFHEILFLPVEDADSLLLERKIHLSTATMLAILLYFFLWPGMELNFWGKSLFSIVKFLLYHAFHWQTFSRKMPFSLFRSFDLKLYFWMIPIKRIVLLENFKDMQNLVNK